MLQSEPDLVEVVGYLAATLTTLSFLPQVVRTWRTRSAEDLSFTMLVAFTSGVLLWLVYGVARRSPPIIAANLVTLVLSAVLIVLQRRFRRRTPHGGAATNRRAT